MSNILIIDDDKDILRLLEFTLKRSGHNVSVAKNGEQGLAIIKSQNMDLVVCDIMMPKMTGYDFCKQVRADETIQHIPIIAFSARFQPIDKQTALQAGATDYLPKSTATDELLKRITELLPAAPQQVAEGLIAVFSLKGGVGATSLAINLAIAYQSRQKTEVALLDMALHGGHAAVMLGLRPTHNVIQTISSLKEDMSENSLKSQFINHSSGVALLASSPTYIENSPFTRDNLATLAKRMRTTFPLTILDVPHLLENSCTPLTPFMDKIILLLSPTMPSLQSTAVALQRFNKLGISDNKLVLVVNHVLPEHTLPINTIQKALKRPLQANIPFETDMNKTINSGNPLLLSHPQSPAAAAINKLATLLSE